MGHVAEGGNRRMKSDTRIFISYTQRDGQVTTSLLEKIGENLGEICFPFIHCVHSSPRRWEQLWVLKNLIR